MAHIVEHLSVEDLERRYRAAEDATEARQIQAIWLLVQAMGGTGVSKCTARG